jgi:glutathione synthase/RimK-type ligase-like ATP-grasp enzyme
LFARVRAPLLRVLFARHEGSWRLDSLQATGLADVPLQDRAFLVEAVKSFMNESSPDGRRLTRPGRARVAILIDPNDPLKPSNDEALARFVKAASRVGLEAELIGPEALERLPEFDALFNRADPEGLIREFLRRAEALGMPVVDEPESVLKCGNKVFMQELLSRHRIPTPRGVIVHRGNVDEVIPALGLPCVLKLPDSAFGLDVVKIESGESLRKEAERFFGKSELLIAQEWLPSEFDWRIGVFDRRPLFAAKYYMAPGHWKVREAVDGQQEPIEGDHETVSVGEVPQPVIQAAVRAANLLGPGLYGADVKQIGDRVYLIEVNVNPNIDAGVEDLVLGDALYREIMGVFARRIAETRGGAAQLRAA